MPRHMEMNIHCAEYVIITCSHYVSGNSFILSNILVTPSWWQLSNLLFKTSLHLFFTFKKLSSTGLKWQSNSMDKTTEQDTGYISLKNPNNNMLDKSDTGGAKILKCLIFKSDFISHFLVQTLLWFPQSNTCFLQQSSSMRDKNSPNFFHL